MDSCMRTLTLLGILLLAHSVSAELQPLPETADDTSALPLAVVEQPVSGGRYQAMILLHSDSELRDFLARADAFAAGSNYQGNEPVALVLYGEEIALFSRNHYRENKTLVDLAARLDAFNVVDLKVCRQWLTREGIQESDLPSFLQPVDDGPAEIQRLQQAGYASF